MNAPEAPTERGLAAERTHLAWGRSAMALLACGAAVFKGIPQVTGSGRPLLGLVMLALGGGVWATSIPLARRRARRGERRQPVTARELAPVAYGTAIVGGAALVIAAFFPN